MAVDHTSYRQIHSSLFTSSSGQTHDNLLSIHFISTRLAYKASHTETTSFQTGYKKEADEGMGFHTVGRKIAQCYVSELEAEGTPPRTGGLQSMDVVGQIRGNEEASPKIKSLFRLLQQR